MNARIPGNDFPFCMEESSIPTAERFDVKVCDPFGVACDKLMPTLMAAIDPVAVQKELQKRLSHLSAGQTVPRLLEIRVVRYKPGRRCLVEYDIECLNSEGFLEQVTLIGKVRVRRYGNADTRLLKAFWMAGFQADSEDEIAVPEALGTLSAFQMCMQRKVPGCVTTALLLNPEYKWLAIKIAEAAHKLHRSNVPTKRVHFMQDELRILHEHLPKVGRYHEHWSGRIRRILDAADCLGSATPVPTVTGIHRDFYADQVIVDNRRLTLIDFDLYCLGDPGLDIGNFIGHVTEQSLRTCGDPNKMRGFEELMAERFVALSGEQVRISIKSYTTLTLIRHIYLSTLFPERHPFTTDLMEICEERLQILKTFGSGIL